jgi:hypothetical protein
LGFYTGSSGGCGVEITIAQNIAENMAEVEITITQICFLQ